MKRAFIFITCSLLSSCQIYRTCFDCPPSEGVPCTSVHEIEERILETDQGPDIFLGNEIGERGLKAIKDSNCCNPCENGVQPSIYRVWLNDRQIAPGIIESAHYIYFSNGKQILPPEFSTRSNERQ